MPAAEDNPVARLLGPLARLLAILSGWWLLALSFLTVAEILLRKLLSVSIQGVDEIGGYTLAVVSAFGFANALLVKGHTRVDFLLGRLPGWPRAALNALAYALLAGLAAFAVWRGWAVLSESIEFQSRANSPLQTPLWLPQSAWLAGIAVFAAAAGAMAAHALMLLATDWRRVNRLYGPLTVEEEVDIEVGAVHARGGAGGEARP
jgi:TRAP-type C4-dicarboxylate transport system permease small subunit